MRKFTLLIASLFITIGAMAQFEAGKEYRIRVVDGDAAGEYVTIGDNLGGAFGYVHTMALDENNADQKFTFVSSNGNWKVKSVNEEYFAHSGSGTGWNNWNLNKTTNESSATEVIFVSTGTENEYYLRANTSQYFKVGAVDGGGSSYKHVYYNAAEGERTKFAVEEVEEINASPVADGVYTIDNIYNGRGSMCYGTWNGAEYFGLTNITLSGCTGNNLTVDPVANKYWYVKTTERGIYFYNIGKGYFLQEQSATKVTCAEDVANGFTFEKRTANSTNYISVKDGDYYLSYSCGWAPNSSDGAVRWIADSEAAATLFTFTVVADAATTYATEIATADEKIAAFEDDNSEAKAQLREALDNASTLLGSISIGVGVGKYSGAYSQSEAESYLEGVEEFYNSIDDTTPAATIAEYTTRINEVVGSYTLNMPEAGNYYRLKGFSGNYIDATSLHDTNSRQMSMKSAEECNLAGTIFYYDNESHLLNYATGTYTRETREIGTIGYAYKSVWNITASPRNNATYALEDTNRENTRNGAHLHDSAGNRADRCSSNCGTRHDFVIEAVTELPVTVTAAGFATLYAPVALEVAEGVKAYTVTINGDWATLNEITSGIIPANTGVVIAGANGEAATAGTYNFAITTTETTATSDLRGSAPATYYTEPGTYYALAQLNGKVGFYKDAFNNSRFQNNSHKAYLYVAEGSANVASYSFRFGEGTTGINEVKGENGNVKAIFDLTGRRVENITAPGIYIVGGRKVLVK